MSMLLIPYKLQNLTPANRDETNHQPTKLASDTARYSSSSDGTKCCPFLLPSPSTSYLSSAQTALSTLYQKSRYSPYLTYFQSGKHRGKSKPSL